MQWHFALHMHETSHDIGVVHGRNRHCVWCLMVCREYMLYRNGVWCSMVGSIKWDNVQNESHDSIKEKENKKYVC